MFETKKPFGVKEKEVPLCSIKPFFTYKSVFLKKLCGNGVPYFLAYSSVSSPFFNRKDSIIYSSAVPPSPSLIILFALKFSILLS